MNMSHLLVQIVVDTKYVVMITGKELGSWQHIGRCSSSVAATLGIVAANQTKVD